MTKLCTFVISLLISYQNITQLFVIVVNVTEITKCQITVIEVNVHMLMASKI